MPSFPVRQSSPENALPPGRMGYDINADHFLLHTIQTTNAFDELVRTGSLYPKPDLAEPEFADAYDWMYRQMAHRLPTTGSGALWFWARTTREHLISTCRRGRGGVLLTCRIPRERALLSHFFDWHMPLNRGVTCARRPGETEERWLDRWEAASDDHHERAHIAGVGNAPLRDWPLPLREETERTWDCILERSNYGPFEYWQATTHALFDSDVIEATRISG